MQKRIAALAVAAVLCGCTDTGTGEKVGQIIKLNKQGLFCQTWEAELIRGGINNGSGASSTVFDFTVENESLIPALQDALDKQYEVKIHYRMEFATFCRSDSENHFLTSIERLNAPGHALEVSPAVDEKDRKRRELQEQLKALDAEPKR